MNWQILVSNILATGVTQVQLAESVGCQQNTISELLRGSAREPRGSRGTRLIAFARGRGVVVPDVIEPTEPDAPLAPSASGA